MKLRLDYLYFIAAIAPFEALIGVSLQELGPIIAYNLILAITPPIIAYAFYTMGSNGARRGGLIVGSLSLVKIASMTIVDLPPLADAVVDGLLILSMLLSVYYLWPGKDSALSTILGVLGVGLVTVKLGWPTLVGGLVLESAALILAGAVAGNYSKKAVESG